jgi:dTDP-4-amino-4,6-dideoxy-D-glucose acyltransferase
MIKGYFSDQELRSLNVKHFGKNVLISKDARLYNPEDLTIRDNVRIDAFCLLSGKIDIGSYVHIASFCLLQGKYGITMGNFSGLSSRVSVYTANEDYSSGSSLTNPTIPEKFRRFESGSVKFDEHSIVGANSLILPSSHLKEGVAVGAFSLVKGTCKSWHLYTGIPAKPIRLRPNKIILNDAKKLLK